MLTLSDPVNRRTPPTPARSRVMPRTPYPLPALFTPRTPAVRQGAQSVVSPRGSPCPETPLTPAESKPALLVKPFTPKVYPPVPSWRPNTAVLPLPVDPETPVKPYLVPVPVSVLLNRAAPNVPVLPGCQ